jgi:hypothetical protein
LENKKVNGILLTFDDGTYTKYNTLDELFELFKSSIESAPPVAHVATAPDQLEEKFPEGKRKILSAPRKKEEIKALPPRPKTTIPQVQVKKIVLGENIITGMENIKAPVPSKDVFLKAIHRMMDDAVGPVTKNSEDMLKHLNWGFPKFVNDPNWPQSVSEMRNRIYTISKKLNCIGISVAIRAIFPISFTKIEGRYINYFDLYPSEAPKKNSRVVKNHSEGYKAKNPLIEESAIKALIADYSDPEEKLTIQNIATKHNVGVGQIYYHVRSRGVALRSEVHTKH